MARLLIVMLLNLAVARWIYDEVAMVAPSAVPYLDAALAKLRIPTHDKWNEIEADQFIAKVTGLDVAHAEDREERATERTHQPESDAGDSFDWF